MEPRTAFPLWIEWSGLPEALYARSRGSAPWLLFRRIVELDVERNGARPDVVEIPPADLATMLGLPAKRIPVLVTSLRKAGLLRAFLPDEPTEPALFQVIVPLATPVAAEDLVRTRPELARVSLAEMRYATPPEGVPDLDERLRRVADLYLNLFSMKMNSFVLDQLHIIAERYDPALVERVFAAAHRRGATTLSWVLAEIRREDAVKRAAAADEAGSGVG